MHVTSAATEPEIAAGESGRVGLSFNRVGFAEISPCRKSIVFQIAHTAQSNTTALCGSLPAKVQTLATRNYDKLQTDRRTDYNVTTTLQLQHNR